MTPEEFAQKHPHPDQCGQTHLYKFAYLDERHPERTELLLKNGRLYHARPSSFNDPWEAKPWVRIPETSEDLMRFRSRMVREVIRNSDLSRREAERSVSETLSNREEFEQNWFGAIEDVFGSALICSLTATNDNILLWSHYAASHTGFCVGFDATKLPFHFAFKVAYQNKYPTVGYPMNTHEPLSVLATKSTHWEYEQEFRIICIPTSQSRPGRYDGQIAILPDQSLTDVYFGAKISDDHRAILKEMIQSGPFDPRIHDAELSESEFSISFRPDV